MDKVTYRLCLENAQEYSFTIDTRRNFDELASDIVEIPDWVNLERHQCENCPLDARTHPHCPAALSILQVAERFDSDLSIARVDCWVETEERTYYRNADLQSCLRSVFGLAMSTSSCPILSRLRPMAYFHLPFATLEETMFRLVTTYLLKQYLAAKEGGTPDWGLAGIESLYLELGKVNHHLLRRLRLASREDANINALQSYISIATLVGMSLDDILRDYIPILENGM